jgi:Uma2 family endonuclease
MLYRSSYRLILEDIPMAQAVSDKPISQPLPRTPITLDEYMALGSDAYYEVIDGELVEMAPQNINSNFLARAIFRSLDAYVAANKLGQTLTEAVFALEVEEPSRWLKGSLVPDVAFISNERFKGHFQDYAKESAFRVAPDLAFEILSPTDSFTAIMRKVKRYLQYGVLLVIVVDPVNRAVHCYTPDNPDGRVLGEDDTLTGDPVLPGWSIPVREILNAKPDLD